MHLLISLGTSWPIVPEAFLHPDHVFAEVHILTTSADQVTTALQAMRNWFSSEAPETTVTVTRLADLPELTHADDHEAFEEGLFRWFAERRAAARVQGMGVQVCLAGGYKTMSAAMQQAADVFGCDGLFHVLAKDNPRDAAEIAAAVQKGEIHWIELGPRAGWPEFREGDDAVGPGREWMDHRRVDILVRPKNEGMEGRADISVCPEGKTMEGTGRNARPTKEEMMEGTGRNARPTEKEEMERTGGNAHPTKEEMMEGTGRNARPTWEESSAAEHADRWIPRLPAAERTWRLRVAESLRRFQRIAEHWDRLEELPFRALAALPATELAWLREPLDPADPRDRAWVARLPKVELHCHLGGFATSGDLLLDVRAAAAEPDRLPPLKEIPTPAGWPLPSQPYGLAPYMTLGDNNGSAILKDPGCLRRQIQRLHDHLRDEHVVYAEIRCSPGNYADPARGRSAWDVLTEIIETFDACGRAVPEGELRPQVQLLIIATRRDGGDFRTGISRHLALAVTAAEHWKRRDGDGCRVVGVDLAGYEDRATRAHYFREDFTAVHRAGLAVTVHAGENDDAEAIWSAVFDLNARRIGHALHLIQSPALLDAVAARGIGIEMCPYANQQIVGFALRDGDGFGDGAGDRLPYPLSEYLRRGIPVSVNTDNIGISGASLTDNLLLAARLCPGLTRLNVVTLIANAARTSFLAEPERRQLLGICGKGISPVAARFQPLNNPSDRTDRADQTDQTAP